MNEVAALKFAIGVTFLKTLRYVESKRPWYRGTGRDNWQHYDREQLTMLCASYFLSLPRYIGASVQCRYR